jgi:hypothetical protein
MPTAHAAPPLNLVFSADAEPPPVWPDADGTVRGIEFSPLYKSVPQAAKRDAKLYQLLALVDAIRAGEGPEREAAVRELQLRLAIDTTQADNEKQ